MLNKFIIQHYSFMDNGKVNILIVDDRPDKILALEAVLEDLRQNIVRAYSGREALRALLASEFAVILLDVNMPGMDGFETASLIRQRKSSEHVPIIFVTAFGDENHSSRGYSLGAVDYIQTPVVPEVLRTKVSVFVDLYRKSEQVRRQAGWLQQRAGQLHSLTAASLAINSALSMEKMLRIVTDTARSILSTHRASTTMVSDGNWARGMTVVSASDRRPTPRGGDPRPDGTGIESLVCESNRPVRMSQREVEDQPLWQLHGGQKYMRGWLAAPLTGRDGRNMGIVELTDRVDGTDFTGDDEALLVQLAQMASIAIENTFYAEEREANRIKDEFLSTLSHELRTPLNAILGWTQLLRSGPAGGLDMEEVSHAIEVIERNAKAQAKLVEDLLDVSRVTTGKIRLNLRPLNLWQVIVTAVDAVRPVAEAKQIAVELEQATEDHRVSGDPDRLQQVTWNLLSNAVKFTPPGGSVQVRLERAGGNLRMRVSDTGQGISASFLPYVFDRFRQADATSTRAHGGLGIGLTIVRHIVEMHGGSVHAESAGEGQGSTFTIEIAAIADQHGRDKADPRAEAVWKEHSGAPAELRGVRVMIVDDEADAREVVSEILRRAQAEVVVAENVQEALASLTHSRPDVLISDIAMPGQDGYDLIRLIREIPGAGEDALPAIALTAYAREEDRLRSISAGFQAHLSKPVAPTELVAAVAHLCPRQSRAVAG
jgi:signal transduction histidine kinase/DNA-binding response OmpR family regulator